ncbi:MAG: DNA polymerase IV [Gammaproteobacteria bacterium]|nr:DNA polymerase IV [Gammaproteobacteria bacterium]
MSRVRCILHVDMDAFYASIEQRDEPGLRGRPVAVGGTGQRGVVAAASYEARRYGVRSAMPVGEALRRCPELVRVAPRMALYRQESARIFEIFARYTPEIEGLSLDEAFLDVTASLALFRSPVVLAERLKTDIQRETGLTASVGIAPNKLVAKIASDLEKPDGLCEVTPQRLHAVLDPLPVAVLPGLGPRSQTGLARLGIHTLGELRRAAPDGLHAVLGRQTDALQRRAAGEDDRPVVVRREEKSISSEETFDQDLPLGPALARELARLADRTASRLRGKRLLAGTVVLKVRRADFTTSTRQQGLGVPSCETAVISATARALLETWGRSQPEVRVRLLGVGVTGLVPASQLGLFGEHSRGGVDAATDSIRERFGDAALTRARTLR